jgi:hypothetical protein
VDIDAQQPLRFGAAERGLRILQIGDQRKTAPVIGLAVEGRTDVTRRPLQELDAEPRFELFHGVRHR